MLNKSSSRNPSKLFSAFFSTYFFVCLIALCGLPGSVTAQAISPANPKDKSGHIITSGTLDLPLREIYPGEPIREKIIWENNTSQVLHLEKFQISCGCTKPEVRLPIVLKPGQRFVIPIAMETGGRSGFFSEDVEAISENGESLWDALINGKAENRFGIISPVITKRVSPDNEDLISAQLLLKSYYTEPLRFKVEIDKPWAESVKIDSPSFIDPGSTTTINLHFTKLPTHGRRYIEGRVVYESEELHPFTVTLIGVHGK